MGILRKALLLSVASALLQAGVANADTINSTDLQSPAADGSLERFPVVINEVLASNDNYVADPQGGFDDWIELYNTSDAPVDVGGLYLTDDPAVPTRWRIPADRAALTTIPAHGFLTIWADKDTSEAGLHASFSLNAGGETLALADADGVTVLDSVSFGEQRADISYGRFPDGTDTWLVMDIPTPKAPTNSRISIRGPRRTTPGAWIPSTTARRTRSCGRSSAATSSVRRVSRTREPGTTIST